MPAIHSANTGAQMALANIKPLTKEQIAASLASKSTAELKKSDQELSRLINGYTKAAKDAPADKKALFESAAQSFQKEQELERGELAKRPPEAGLPPKTIRPSHAGRPPHASSPDWRKHVDGIDHLPTTSEMQARFKKDSTDELKSINQNLTKAIDGAKAAIPKAMADDKKGLEQVMAFNENALKVLHQELASRKSAA